MEDNWEVSSANQGPLGNSIKTNAVSKIPAPLLKSRRMPPIIAHPATMATGLFPAASMAPAKAALVMGIQRSSFPLT